MDQHETLQTAHENINGERADKEVFKIESIARCAGVFVWGIEKSPYLAIDSQGVIFIVLVRAPTSSSSSWTASVLFGSNYFLINDSEWENEKA